MKIFSPRHTCDHCYRTRSVRDLIWMRAYDRDGAIHLWGCRDNDECRHAIESHAADWHRLRKEPITESEIYGNGA